MKTIPGVLQIESLEATMRNITFDIKDIRHWPYFKYPAEYQRLLYLLAKLKVKIT